MQSEVVARINEYVATLKSSGAPHQQELASDLNELMECVHRAMAPPPPPANDDRDAQIEQLQTNVSQLMDERDEARQRLADARIAHGAATPVKGEEHVTLKAKSKSKSGNAST